MAVNNFFTDAVDSDITRSKDAIFTDLEGEVVIFNIKSGKYYNLNAMGSFIWKSIEQSTKISSVIEAVLSVYNVDRQRCENDVRSLMHNLYQAGLVEISSVKPVDAPDPQ